MDFDGPVHGSDGPILVRRVNEFDGCTASFVNAATETGYPWVPDLNGATPEDPLPPGIGAVPLNINGGIRIGPGGAYLLPAHERPNLTLLATTHVTRIRFEKGRAVGVDGVGAGGAVDLTADRIVLCAGAIGSAHLLMLSGVGPAEVLASVSIPVIADLPVGMRTSDHPEWVLPVGLDANPRSTSAGGGSRPLPTGSRSGRTRGASAQWWPARPSIPPTVRISGVALMQPRSRGRVSVVSGDPEVPPMIEHRYDSDPHDVATLSAGAELARELASPTTKVGPATWSTSQHLAGTAPMGTDGDAAAVVDDPVPGARCRRAMGGRRVDLADHHQPRPPRHDRDARPPRRRVRHPERTRRQSLDEPELPAVAARRPDGDEQRGDGEHGRDDNQRQVHRVEEGALGELGQRRRPADRSVSRSRARWPVNREPDREPVREMTLRSGASAFVYCAASTEPATAMPTAAPTSRVVSLTADATPCFSVGTAFMMADVVGATHKPMPVLVIRNGQTSSM